MTRDFSAYLKDEALMASWTIPNDGPLTDAQRRAVLKNFLQYIERKKLSIADVAQQVGTPRQSLIREMLKGEFREHVDKHIRTLNFWVEQHARQEAVTIESKFVQTRVAKAVFQAATLTRDNATMGLVFGPTGIGKSRCAQAVYESIVGSVLMRVRNGITSPKGLISYIADRLNCRDGDDSGRTQFERIVHRLKDSSRLLIFDEAHKLTDRALDTLRDIHDETGVPILLIATKDLQLRIEKNSDPDHGQLYSRFDVVCPLSEGRDGFSGGKPLFTIEDIRKLYESTPVRLAADAARYLQDIANQLGRGSLRRCRMLLQNAAKRSRKRQELDDDEAVTVTADDLEVTEITFRSTALDKEFMEDRRRRSAAASS